MVYDDCRMCGKRPSSEYRWYRYDNNEQFLEKVCVKCAEMHDGLVAK